MSQQLFGTNGVRGVVNVDMTPEFALEMGLAIGSFFGKGQVIIGHDGRVSSWLLKEAVTSGLCASGVDVLDLGLAPTPAIEYIVKKEHRRGGVIITASHNPAEFNGIKVCDGDGVELPREKEILIEECFFKKDFQLQGWRKLGRYGERKDWADLYLEGIKSHIDSGTIAEQNFFVVVDLANGVAGSVVPRLLRELGCRIYSINSHLDGCFPGRTPEPTPQSLENLAKAVVATGASFGVGFDGDADRALFVDEKGRVLHGDRTLALMVKYFLRKNPGEQVVTPISSSQVIGDVVRAEGGRLVLTRVGAINISRKMVEVGAKMGGEENGGVCFGLHQSVRDGAMSTALILQILAEEKKSLSRVLSTLPTYHNFKDKVPCPNVLKEKVKERLIGKVKGVRVETLDGVKIWLPGKSWILIRASGTEPIYRLFAESKKLGEPEKIVGKYRKIVTEIISEESRLGS